MVFGLAPAGATLFSTVGFFVYRSPGASLSPTLGGATFLVAFLDVLGHSLLLVAVAGFFAAKHCNLPCQTAPLRNSYSSE